MSASTGCPVVYFEIGCKDLPGNTSFYADLFGWSPMPTPMSSMINTNSSDGVQGHIVSLGHEPHQYVTFYIQVEDIADRLAAIEKAGGKQLLGPFPLPDGKQFAWFSDPGGNMIGLVTK